jgi:hypothetical protein
MEMGTTMKSAGEGIKLDAPYILYQTQNDNNLWWFLMKVK